MPMPRPEEEVIFNVARRLEPPDARSLYIDRACGSDGELRRRIDALLRVDVGDRAAAAVPAAELRAAFDDTVAERPGLVIGPYKLLEQIGEGGFGVVFMAEQQQPIRRQVAVKIVKPGMDTRQVVSRFEAERAALARMDHPHIARVFDGGLLASGRPYFVMELVRGVPITVVCDRDRLSVRQRLELAIDVCEAVQHAHQKGIIHRDLKPSNVLVTRHDGTAVVKIIDFGIAKAIGAPLTDGTLFTGFAQFVGTPLYMSPEQMELSGLDIDTRSDIYALGVLLYELLTGVTPFDREQFRTAAFDEVRRIVREEAPTPPSQRISTLQETATVTANRRSDPKRLHRLLRGELDWIVMKCLEKDRTRRYATAGDLARDLQRHLANEPVEARPPSVRYRLAKFLHRNRQLAIAGTLTTLLLVGGIVGTSIGLARASKGEQAARDERATADRQRERAERHYQHALSAVDRLLTRAGGDGLAASPHMDQTRRRLLEDALQFYQGILADEGDDPIVLREVGRAHGRIGTIHVELGRPEQSEQSLLKAVEIQRGLTLRDPDNDDYRTDLWKTQRVLALTWFQAGRGEDAARLLRDILRSEPGISSKCREEFAQLQYTLGIVCRDLRRPAEAETALKAAVAIHEEPDQREHDVGRSSALNMLGLICREGNRLDEAERHYRAALQILERVATPNTADPDVPFRIAGVLNNLGLVTAALNRPDEAEAAYRKSAGLLGPLAQDHPDLPEYKRHLANAHSNLALLFAKTGDPKRALEENAVSMGYYEDLMRRYPRRIEFAMQYAGACGNHGKYLFEQDNLGESIVWNTKAIETLTKVVGDKPGQLFARLQIFSSLTGRAGAYRILNQPEKAADDYRKTIALSEGEAHPTFINFRPRALAFVGEHAKAAAEAEAVVAKATATGANCKEMANVLTTCSEAARRDARLSDAERPHLAETYATRAVALLAAAGKKGHFKTSDQITALKTDEKLRPLADRGDFQRLLAELSAKPTAGSNPQPPKSP